MVHFYEKYRSFNNDYDLNEMKENNGILSHRRNFYYFTLIEGK